MRNITRDILGANLDVLLSWGCLTDLGPHEALNIYQELGRRWHNGSLLTEAQVLDILETRSLMAATYPSVVG